VKAVENLRPYLRNNARFVAFGSQLTKRRFGVILNTVSKSLMKLSFESTPKLNFEPWAPLKAYCSDIEVQEFVHGCFFLVSGSMQPDHHEIARP